ncbi:hypothetical protein [Janthinobacterium sp. 78]|uniref:hypothetical protein n=1 Tax=Janthinobacterium sp. 78 TaxID=2135631 RepID=UPI000D5F2C78|nr:hypothetical protein [Janthinobacterium sp. 78]PVX38181.1 hypothetical protein C8C92_4850 [Janthinobacterium sp. 78]
MCGRVDRYQALRRARASASTLVLLPPAAAVREIQAQDVDPEYVDAPFFGTRLPPHADVTPAEMQALLAEMSAQLDGQRWTGTLHGIRSTVMQNIAGQFGVGKLVSALDKTGGAVNTVHNARQGVYATEQEARRYGERGNYDSTGYHQHSDYIAAHRSMSASLEQGTLTDTYTGEVFHLSDKNDRQRMPHLEHAVSAKRVHDDGGRILAELDGPALAATEANLKATGASINCAFKDRTAEQNLQRLATTQAARTARIAELETKPGPMMDQHRKELTKLKKLDKVDARRVRDAEAQAKAAIDSKVNRTYYGSGKFLCSAASASVVQGTKMGVQQALGIVLVEFFAALFDEIGDLYSHGMREDSYIREAGVRLRPIAARVAGKWEAVHKAFKEGFISGLLSSLVTTVVNAFLTTGKRAVRMIREGGLSLMQAVRLLVFRPAGMSRSEALHAASKIVIGGLLVGGGIVLEEVVGKQLLVLGPLGEGATAVIVGSLMAIVMALAIYLVDKLDLFGTVQLAHDREVGAMLDGRIAATEQQLGHLQRLLLIAT